MKVLVTGGAGFIGSHIVDSLIKKGYAVSVYDNLSWGFEDNINCKANVEYIPCELRNSSCLLEALDGVNLVIHCAASLEVTLGQDHPEKDLSTNTLGTISLLEAMKKASVRNLINFSSACVYGPGKIGMPAVDVNAASLERTHWSYGSSKLSAEIYCNQYANTYGIKVFNLRPGIVCGPREWFGRVLTIFIKNALEGKDLVIFGDGAQERDFVHVYDVVDVVNNAICMLLSGNFSTLTFNVGTGTATSVNTLAHTIAEKFNVGVVYENVEEGNISKLVDGRIRLPFEMQSMRLDMRYTNYILDRTNSYGLNDIIEDTVNWYKLNKQRWNAEWKV